MAQKIIKSTASSQKKSKLQFLYENLLIDIEVKKAALINLEEGMQMVYPRIIKEIKPLIIKQNLYYKKKFLRLDEVSEEIKVDRTYRAWFDNYMIEQVGDLLRKSGGEDEELRDLYTKYAGEEYKEIKNALDQVNAGEPEVAKNTDAFNDRAKPKNKKEAVKEKRAEYEQEMLEKDAKAVYLRLIKKFHPDTVQDTALKESFTEISMMITKAYQSNDFLGLLKLQIEYIDEQETSSLAEEMLKRYNKILQQQLTEIEFKIEQAKVNSMGMYEEFFDKNHHFSPAKFKSVKRDFEHSIAYIQRDIADSYKYKKDWFKSWISEIKNRL